MLYAAVLVAAAALWCLPARGLEALTADEMTAARGGECGPAPATIIPDSSCVADDPCWTWGEGCETFVVRKIVDQEDLDVVFNWHVAVGAGGCQMAEGDDCVIYYTTTHLKHSTDNAYRHCDDVPPLSDCGFGAVVCATADAYTDAMCIESAGLTVSLYTCGCAAGPGGPQALPEMRPSQ